MQSRVPLPIGRTRSASALLTLSMVLAGGACSTEADPAAGTDGVEPEVGTGTAIDRPAGENGGTLPSGTDSDNGTGGDNGDDSGSGTGDEVDPVTPVGSPGAGAESGGDVSVGCDTMRDRALALINAARAEPRRCGADGFDAAGALGWDSRLQAAALAHSTDMTAHNFFDHTGSDGGTVATRVADRGYDWRAVGENIAAGQESVEQAIAGWIDSPGHCRNLMNPRYRDVALACVEDESSDYGRYWTNVFGRAP